MLTTANTYKIPMLESIIKYRLSDPSQIQLEENQQLINNMLDSSLLSDMIGDDSSLDIESLEYATVAKAVLDLLNKASTTPINYGTISNPSKNPDQRNLIDILKIYKIIKYSINNNNIII